MAFKWILIFTVCKLLVVASTATSKTTSKIKEKSGPYITVLKSIVPCEKPAVPYLKEPRVLLDVTVKNNIVKGNFTIIGTNKNLQVTMQDMYYIDGQWQTTFIAKNMSCRSKWINMMVELLGVHYDKRTCAVPKGSYVFEVDYNKLDHTWMPYREYGRVLRRLEAHNREGTIVCSEFDSDIKPAN